LFGFKDSLAAPYAGMSLVKVWPELMSLTVQHFGVHLQRR
jgi:hypothetical protein